MRYLSLKITFLFLLINIGQATKAGHVGGAHEHFNTLFTVDDYDYALDSLASKYWGEISTHSGGGSKEESEKNLKLQFRFYFYSSFLNSNSMSKFLNKKEQLKRFIKANNLKLRELNDESLTKWIQDKESTLLKLLKYRQKNEGILEKIVQRHRRLLADQILTVERLYNVSVTKAENSDLLRREYYQTVSIISGNLFTFFQQFLINHQQIIKKILRENGATSQILNVSEDSNYMLYMLAQALKIKADFKKIPELIVSASPTSNHEIYRILKDLFGEKIKLLISVNRNDLLNELQKILNLEPKTIQLFNGIDIVGSLGENDFSFLPFKVQKKQPKIPKRTLKSLDNAKNSIKKLSKEKSFDKSNPTKEVIELRNKIKKSEAFIKEEKDKANGIYKAELEKAKAQTAEAFNLGKAVMSLWQSDAILRIHWLESKRKTFDPNDNFLKTFSLLLTSTMTGRKNPRFIIGHSYQLKKLSGSYLQDFSNFLLSIKIPSEINVNRESNKFLLNNGQTITYKKVFRRLSALLQKKKKKLVLTEGSDGRSFLHKEKSPFISEIPIARLDSHRFETPVSTPTKKRKIPSPHQFKTPSKAIPQSPGAPGAPGSPGSPISPPTKRLQENEHLKSINDSLKGFTEEAKKCVLKGKNFKKHTEDILGLARSIITRSDFIRSNISIEKTRIEITQGQSSGGGGGGSKDGGDDGSTINLQTAEQIKNLITLLNAIGCKYWTHLNEGLDQKFGARNNLSMRELDAAIKELQSNKLVDKRPWG